MVKKRKKVEYYKPGRQPSRGKWVGKPYHKTYDTTELVPVFRKGQKYVTSKTKWVPTVKQKKELVYARVEKVAKSQTGKSNTKLDEKRKALYPGKRESYRGNVYYERRKNRSDLRGNV